MNKQQKIDYIREKVIIANNPECKTLEDALEKESLVSGCLVKHITSPLSPQDRKVATAIILWDDGVDSSENKRWFCFNDNITFTTIQKKDKILGLPLTLERVLVALNKKRIRGLCFADNEGIPHYVSDGTNIYLVDLSRNVKASLVCEVVPSKHLDQQSDETIDAIYDILK